MELELKTSVWYAIVRLPRSRLPAVIQTGEDVRGEDEDVWYVAHAVLGGLFVYTDMSSEIADSSARWRVAPTRSHPARRRTESTALHVRTRRVAAYPALAISPIPLEPSISRIR